MPKIDFRGRPDLNMKNTIKGFLIAVAGIVNFLTRMRIGWRDAVGTATAPGGLVPRSGQCPEGEL